jgi:rhodanese-related sulfurtransferase
VARALLEKGYPLVRPHSGGLDGWVSAGYPVEEMLPDELRSA